jgi:hypothetical protein
MNERAPIFSIARYNTLVCLYVPYEELEKPMTDFTNEYCMHTATCGELRKDDCGREVTLTGWAWHNRDHGGLIFVDLRDRAGYTQVVVDPDCVTAEEFATAEHFSREDVLKITGKVRERGEDAVNPNMVTGEIEVLASSIEMLNKSVTPPFSIEDGIETDENGLRVDFHHVGGIVALHGITFRCILGIDTDFGSIVAIESVGRTYPHVVPTVLIKRTDTSVRQTIIRCEGHHTLCKTQVCKEK